MMLTCSKCGWVHMGRSLADVTSEVARFNAFYDTLDLAGKDNYSGPSSVETYRKCFGCGADNAHMRPYVNGDLSEDRAVTIQPILDPIWS